MIQTERLELREYAIQDAPFIYKLMNSEGWIKNIGDRNIKTVDDAEAYMLNNYFPIYEKYGFGPYLVTLKENGTPIGSAGLYKRDNLDFPDIGFAFLAEFGSKGYAFEATQAVMKLAKENFSADTILGIVLPENIKSVKLLQKLGLSEQGTYTYESGEELLLFST